MFKRISSFQPLVTLFLAFVLAVAPLNGFASTAMTSSVTNHSLINHSMTNHFMRMENCHNNMSADVDEAQKTQIPNCCSLHLTAFALPLHEQFINIASFEKIAVFTVVKQLTSSLNFYIIEPPRTTSAL